MAPPMGRSGPVRSGSDSPELGCSISGLLSEQSSACWRAITSRDKVASCSYFAILLSITSRISTMTSFSRSVTNRRSFCAGDILIKKTKELEQPLTASWASLTQATVAASGHLQYKSTPQMASEGRIYFKIFQLEESEKTGGTQIPQFPSVILNLKLLFVSPTWSTFIHHQNLSFLISICVLSNLKYLQK